MRSKHYNQCHQGLSFCPADVIKVSRSLPFLATFAQVHPHTQHLFVCPQTREAQQLNRSDSERNHLLWWKAGTRAGTICHRREWKSDKTLCLALYLGVLNLLVSLLLQVEEEGWAQRSYSQTVKGSLWGHGHGQAGEASTNWERHIIR